MKINKYLDTIVAISSGNINQAISIIRISGKNSIDIIKKIYKGKIGKNKTITYGYIINPLNNEKIDEVLILWFIGTDNYTGENTIEINAHGGVIVTNRILNIILENGARLAERGEFSRRAFLNNKISLNKAEAINNLIHAKNINQTKIAIKQFDNFGYKILREIEQELLKLISMCEINIDYSEYNDIETIENDKLLDSVNLFIGKLTTLIENSERTINVYKGIDVAIIGKPNSGKSSLFNSLLEEEKAIVTNIEGTTRDVLDGEFQIGGILFRILDTAGIRNTKNKIENIGILKSIETIKKAKVILNIIDPTNDKYDDIYESKIKNLITENKVYINVVNKIDICSKEILKKYSNYVWISAANNNTYELKNTLYKIYFKFLTEDVIVNEDVIEKLNSILKSLKNVKEGLKNNYGFETVVIDLREAWSNAKKCLNEEHNNEVLLDNIFKKFCLGK